MKDEGRIFQLKDGRVHLLHNNVKNSIVCALPKYATKFLTDVTEVENIISESG
jgi:hypothetical protein